MKMKEMENNLETKVNLTTKNLKLKPLNKFILIYIKF